MNPKKFTPFIFCCALLSLPTLTALATPVVDGTFDTAEWEGYSTGGSGYNGVLHPGVGKQAYDVEDLGLYFDTNKVYFGLRTGFDLKLGRDYTQTIRGVTRTVHFNPGDFALDVNGDKVYDYAIDFSISGTSANFTLVDMIGAEWFKPYYTQHAEATPFGRSESINAPTTFRGTERATFTTGVYGPFADGGTGGTMDTDPNLIGGKWSNTLEGIFDLSLLSLYNGGPMTIHWTMGCGNDYINHTSEQAPIPEPATMLLFGSGLVGLAGVARKKTAK